MCDMQNGRYKRGVYSMDGGVQERKILFAVTQHGGVYFGKNLPIRDGKREMSLCGENRGDEKRDVSAAVRPGAAVLSYEVVCLKNALPGKELFRMH